MVMVGAGRGTGREKCINVSREHPCGGCSRTPAARPVSDRKGRVYSPAVGPRLRPLLLVILVGFGLLGGNGVYLASVTALTWG